jgi:hypothetical protein
MIEEYFNTVCGVEWRASFTEGTSVHHDWTRRYLGRIDAVNFASGTQNSACNARMSATAGLLAPT